MKHALYGFLFTYLFHFQLFQYFFSASLLGDTLFCLLSLLLSVDRFVNLLTEDMEKTENRERAYGLSHVVNGDRQHRLLTPRDKHQTLRIFADRVHILCIIFYYCPYCECYCYFGFRRQQRKQMNGFFLTKLE